MTTDPTPDSTASGDLAATTVCTESDSPAKPAIGDVGKCPRCGSQSRSYSRGCSNCGHGQPVGQGGAR